MLRQTSYKRIAKKVFGSRLFLFLATLALIALVISLTRETYHKYQLKKEIEHLQEEIGRLEGNNQQLTGLMGYLQDESYAEREAKLKLNLKRPGEKVVIFSNDANETNLDEAFQIDQTPKQTESNFGNFNSEQDKASNHWKWWEYFFAS